ncbi:hypothetical protein CY652_01710 [Burkholderia sp. WAC0059]|uniref:hypothetical protein n=1 Tax=Burkholderia sp. WAC0059 TaxID=2066022 RepID=UPI000C7EA206|nr:hypothetical protein [Burkholderia sp. WAC0059]PLZ04403.1 hypothetical protein CY652_01710 [Burkholderia sp. WAC0059]
MRKVSLAVLVALSALTGVAHAQTENGITMSTDPQRAADIEQHAQDLQAQQEAAPSTESARPVHHHRAPHHHKKAAQ